MIADGGLRRLRLPRALRKAGFHAPAAVDPLGAGEALARGRWDLVVWAARREELAREVMARERVPVLVVLDATRGVAAAVSALGAGFADVVRTDSVSELVARAAAAVRRSRALASAEDHAAGLRELADGGRDVLARIAPDGTVLFASGAARELLGHDPDLLRGTDVLALCHPDERDRLAAALWSDTPTVVEHRVRRHPAGWLWMETAVSPVHDAAGRLREVRIDARDVTGRRRREAELAGLARVTAAVATGADVAHVAEMACREAARALGVGAAAVARLHGDELLVIAAFGPSPRPGERMPMSGGTGRAVAPIRVEGELWGVIAVEGAEAVLGERVAAHADLVATAVVNTRARERLLAMAHTDGLTGLPNARAFRDRRDADCARAARSGAPLCLVMIDLDRFKRINDTFGHQAGDEVLRTVAGLLARSARRGDLPARVGGEELAWLLPDAVLADAHEAAERLRRAIGTTQVAGVGTVTASLGVAQLGPDGPDGLVRRADLALYRAKEDGRDRCVADRSLTASRSA